MRASKLCAKVDNTAIQDGFQLYQHNFVLTADGDWTVVQQGMNPEARTARRYHWSSLSLRSFVKEPHTAIVGKNQGNILNLTDRAAGKTREAILSLSHEEPPRVMREISSMVKPKSSILVPEQTDLFKDSTEPVLTCSGRDVRMPAHHEVLAEDVDLKRLGSVLATAYESAPANFESLLLTPGLGPRTLQSLTLVSEVINGTPSRFADPARFSFAHGGKDGHPFPVPCKVYDESIRVLDEALQKSKLGLSDKMRCLSRLHQVQLAVEQNCSPLADFEKTLEHERRHSAEWGGRVVG